MRSALTIFFAGTSSWLWKSQKYNPNPRGAPIWDFCVAFYTFCFVYGGGKSCIIFVTDFTLEGKVWIWRFYFLLEWMLCCSVRDSFCSILCVPAVSLYTCRQRYRSRSDFPILDCFSSMIFVGGRLADFYLRLRWKKTVNRPQPYANSGDSRIPGCRPGNGPNRAGPALGSTRAGGKDDSSLYKLLQIN